MTNFALVKEPQISVFVVSIVFAVLNIPFVVVRFVARRRAWGHFGLSDAALLAALVSHGKINLDPICNATNLLNSLLKASHHGPVWHCRSRYVPLFPANP